MTKIKKMKLWEKLYADNWWFIELIAINWDEYIFRFNEPSEDWGYYQRWYHHFFNVKDIYLDWETLVVIDSDNEETRYRLVEDEYGEAEIIYEEEYYEYIKRKEMEEEYDE